MTTCFHFNKLMYIIDAIEKKKKARTKKVQRGNQRTKRKTKKKILLNDKLKANPHCRNPCLYKAITTDITPLTENYHSNSSSNADGYHTNSTIGETEPSVKIPLYEDKSVQTEDDTYKRYVIREPISQRVEADVEQTSIGQILKKRHKCQNRRTLQKRNHQLARTDSFDHVDVISEEKEKRSRQFIEERKTYSSERNVIVGAKLQVECDDKLENVSNSLPSYARGWKYKQPATVSIYDRRLIERRPSPREHYTRRYMEYLTRDY